MANTPVQVQILDEVEARLRLIDQANGYLHTIVKTERARLTPWDGIDMPSLNFWMETDVRQEKNYGFEVRQMGVRVETRDKTRERPFVDVASEHLADIWTALQRDPSAPAVTDPISMSLGGLVTHVNFESMIPAIGEGQNPYCGALIDLSVTYNIDPSEPFTLIP
jgi:hypothetical protein